MLLIGTLGTDSSEKWNLKQNPWLFIQGNAFENVVCEMAMILSGPQYVNVNDKDDCLDQIVVCWLENTYGYTWTYHLYQLYLNSNKG